MKFTNHSNVLIKVNKHLGSLNEQRYRLAINQQRLSISQHKLTFFFSFSSFFTDTDHCH